MTTVPLRAHLLCPATGKVKYSDARTAWQEAGRICTEEQRAMEAYECTGRPPCGGWHTSRVNKFKQRKGIVDRGSYTTGDGTPRTIAEVARVRPLKSGRTDGQ